MISILVLTGTTGFDSLIRHIDTDPNWLKCDVDLLFQIGNGRYIPKNFPWIDYDPKIKTLIEKSDLIITHAGAGSVFSLLDQRSKFIVIPNLDRKDQHQAELCRFLERNNYAYACWDLTEIKFSFLSELVENYDFRQYKKKNFDKKKMILDIIKTSKR